MLGLFLASIAISVALTGVSLLPEDPPETSTEERWLDAPRPAWLSGPVGSLRFWILSALGFGLAGAPLSLLGLYPLLALLVALLSGGALGRLLWPLFEQPSCDVTLAHLAGAEGRVLRAIGPRGGRIVVETALARLELPARSGDGSVIRAGRRVFVAFVEGGVACVVGFGR